MSPKRSISRRAWAIFFAGILALSASLFAARWAQPPIATPQPELSRLLAERDRLSWATDAARRPLVEQWTAMRRGAWNSARLAGLELEMASRWRWEWEPGNQPNRATLHAIARSMDEWQHCVATLRTLSARPGVIVEALDVRARGTAAQRSFTTMTIGVRFVRDEPATSDAKRAAPSRSPLPVAAGDDPDTLRNVGSGPPLRSVPARPSGSASGLINQDPKKETNRP